LAGLGFAQPDLLIFVYFFGGASACDCSRLQVVGDPLQIVVHVGVDGGLADAAVPCPEADDADLGPMK
jgi:hypothetical protein